MSNRLTAKEIADSWGVSPQRVSELVKQGRLHRGDDGLFDAAAVKAYREWQIANHGRKVLLSTSSNGKVITGNKADAMAGAGDFFDGDFFDEPAAPEPAKTGAAALIDANARMLALKERKAQLDIDRAEARHQRDMGLLVSKEAVRQEGLAAGKIMATILNTLPAEIAGVFADVDRKAAVHRAVQAKVDQIQHALQQALTKVAPDVP